MKCEHDWIKTESRWKLICAKCNKTATKQPIPIMTKSTLEEQKKLPFELRMDISIS